MNSNEVFNNFYFIYNKKLLIASGNWPYQSKRLKYLVRSAILFAIHTMMIAQMIRGMEEYYGEKNLAIMVENFAGVIYFEGTITKYTFNLFTEKKLVFLYEQITKDWKNITDEGEKAVLEKHAGFARLLTKIYLTYTYSSVFVYVGAPIVIPKVLDIIIPKNESRPLALCYYAEYFVDEQEYFYYLVLHSFICVCLCVLIVSGVDCTFVSIVHHAIGLFKIIAYRMNRLMELTDKRKDMAALPFDKGGSNELLNNYIVDSIKLHKNTIEFSEIIESTYSDCFFVGIFLSLLILSIGTIDLVLNIGNPVDVFRIGLLWMAVILYLFFVNWPGQKIVDSSTALFIDVYSCGWHNLPIKTRYLIKFMMMRCTVPCQLTAGPILQMNFATFGRILRTAMSYFTVVVSLNV